MSSEQGGVGIQDVASHREVAKASIYLWMEGRGVPAHRVGRLFRFELCEIDEWVHRGSRGEANPQARSNRKSPQSRGKLATPKSQLQEG